MRRHLPVFALLLVASPVAATADAQVLVRRPIVERAAAAVGRIDGIVRDQSGAALEGVSVTAFGSALAVVRTDGRGRFSLSLPPGAYALSAVVGGYRAAYRGLVQVESDEALRTFLDQHGLPYILAATKADKLGRGALKSRERSLTTGLGRRARAVIPVSATRHTGLQALWSQIRAATSPEVRHGH